MPDIHAPYEVRMRNGKWAMLANIFKPVILWMSGGVVAAGFAGYAIVESYNATRSAQEVTEVVVEKEMPKAEKKAEKPVEVASLPKKQPEKQAETKPETMSKPAAQSPVASTAEPAPEQPLPKFDILRVEKDGYAVIAGSAPAGSKVEILDGDTVIATEMAGSTSEFVVVLDKPLTPGPHDLVIQVTLEDGKKLLSAEAGIINIPDGKSELLAMVTEPGKASRILQIPESKQEAPKQEVTEQAQKEEPKEAPKEAVVEAPAEAPKVENEPAVEMAEKPAPAPAATPAPVAVEEVKKQETQIALLEQQPKEQPAAEPEAKVEEKPMATAEIAEQPKPATKPIIKVDEPQQTAKVEEPAKPQVPVLIQAAEVEGEKIFIAGTGLSGANVHIYIDGIFLGKTEVGAEGSYVFEGIGGLDAGRHAVRADMVSDNSTEVIARAVVSLLHEPVIIDPVKVAKVEPKPEMVEPAKDMAKMVEEKAPEAKTKKVVVKKAEIASKTTEPAAEKDLAAVAPKPAPAKMSPPSKQPKQEPMKVAAVEEKVEMSSSSELAATPKKMEMTKPAAQMEKPAVKIGSDTTASVAEITTGSSVIIRKGDSLWRVSQRRYGEGVRYTTIFDANRDQIRDPDLIYPGQVFEIPAIKEKS